MNIDGSFSSHRGGYGAAIRNSNGELIAAVAGTCPANSSLYAEAFALWRAAILAHQFGLSNLIIYSDSQLLVSMVEDESMEAWCISPLIEVSKQILSSFCSWKLLHILREGNQVADWLSKWVSDDGERIVSPSQIPPDLLPLLRKDADGYGFERH